MLAQYAAVCKYITTEMYILGHDHPNLNATRESQLNHVLSSINDTKSDVSEAGNLLDELTKETNAFTSDQRKAIATAVSTKMRTVAGVSTRTVRNEQSCPCFYNYLTDGDWASMLGPHASITTIHATISKRGLAIGYGHPKPIEYVMLNAIAQVATRTVYSAQQSYDQKNDLTVIWDVMRKTISWAPSELRFPDDAAEFLRTHPERYTSADPPVKCRVDPVDIKQTTALNPCRHNHRRMSKKMTRAKAEEDNNPRAEVLSMALAQAVLRNSSGPDHCGASQSARTGLKLEPLKDEPLDALTRLAASVKAEPVAAATPAAAAAHAAAAVAAPLAVAAHAVKTAPGEAAAAAAPAAAAVVGAAVPGCLSAAPTPVHDGPKPFLDDLRAKVQAAVDRRKGLPRESVPIAKRRKLGAIACAGAHADDGDWGDDAAIDELAAPVDPGDTDAAVPDDDDSKEVDLGSELAHAAEAVAPLAPAPAAAAKSTAAKAKAMKKPAAAKAMKKPSVAAVPVAAAPAKACAMPAKAAVGAGAKPAKAAKPAKPAKPAKAAAAAGDGRPALSKHPTHYNGGRIYFAPKRGKFGYFRCYKRKVDKVETNVAVKANGAIAAKTAWDIALTTIDNDPRPR